MTAAGRPPSGPPPLGGRELYAEVEERRSADIEAADGKDAADHLDDDQVDGHHHHQVDAAVEAALAELAAAECPWPVVPEAGWNVLEVVSDFLARFVVFPSSAARDAAALWVLHTYAIAAAESTPRLALLSAEKRSGKSRLLELLELLVARPMMTASISAAALFRQVEAVSPTLLMDEADTYFGKAKDDHEDLRGMLNAGHRRGALAYRCAGPKMAEVKAYSAYCAVALAGIGELPSTIADRAITIRMKRRRPDEQVERFRRRKVKPEAERLAARVEAWADANIDALTIAEPELPDALDDRAADGWEPLLAIADAADGEWPARARRAALVLSGDRAPEDDTAGVRLLSDCRAVFGDADRLSSADLAGRLAALEEAPWGAWYGHPLDTRGLAKLLRRFDVRPKQLRVGEEKVRGYDRVDLEDVWGRYLSGPKVPDSPVPASGPVQVVHRRSEALFDPVQADDVYRSHAPSDQPCTGVPVPMRGNGGGRRLGPL